MSKCVVCGEPILIYIFRNEDYCCDDHRKILTGEKPPIEYRIDEIKTNIKDSERLIIPIDGLVKEGGFPITILN